MLNKINVKLNENLCTYMVKIKLGWYTISLNLAVQNSGINIYFFDEIKS